MPDDSYEEKNLPPTDKRRQEAREKGDVAKSTEVNSVLILLSGLWMLLILAPWMLRKITLMMTSSFLRVGHPDVGLAGVVSLFRENVLFLAVIVLPVIGVLLIVGLLANYLQIGFLFTLSPLMPKLEKINPISGFQRLLSLRSFVEALKSILKVSIIALVAFLTMKQRYATFMTLADAASVGIIWVYLLKTGFTIVMRIILVLIVLAILDYLYQRYEHEKKLKMSQKEVEEERKQMEGDPQVKRRIRSLQREMARRRMMEEVPRATVVVTNPTFIAIALRYEPNTMETPVVLAKGKRILAERIKEIAAENGIPIVEDKPLARGMFDKISVGEAIPGEFFAAVAEILAYVYRLRAREAA